MTENDKELIRQAEKTNSADWDYVCYLEEQAESDEAKKRLETIRIILYHLDEAHNDML